LSIDAALYPRQAVDECRFTNSALVGGQAVPPLWEQLDVLQRRQILKEIAVHLDETPHFGPSDAESSSDPRRYGMRARRRRQPGNDREAHPIARRNQAKKAQSP
jgi:hypothetical protein